MSASVAAVPWLEAASTKRWLAGAVTGDPAPGTGALLGTQLEPWYLAKLDYEAGWNEAFECMTSVQVELAESQGFTHAIHVNLDGSKDRGIWQLNSIHAWITDEIAYDPVLATDAAFKLWSAANGWKDWAAYTTGVFLHDSYLGRAARGFGNYLARTTLDVPVPDWAGQPYTHKYAGSILDFQHRVAGCVAEVQAAKKTLGWQATTKKTVDAVQSDLSQALIAAKRPLPA